LRGAAFELIDIGGKRIDLDANRGGGFVDEVDGLVGQEAVGDVAMRERGRGDDGGIFDADAVMHFVLLFQAAKDGDGVFDIGLADENNLEAAFEGGIFFDVLAVLVERGGADGAQFAASQRGLEHVGGVNGAFGGAGADQSVQLVDEKNYCPCRVFDFLQDGFEAVFEFAAIFCAGQHGAEIERDDALVLEDFGHVAGNDALGEAFDDGGLADAGFADEHGIIFRAAGENLDHAADFFVAADDGIELAAAGLLGEVASVAFESLILGFGILVGDFLRAADGGQSFQNRVVGCAVTGEDLLGRILLEMRDGQQQVLGGDVLVLEVGGFFEGLLEQLVGGVRERGLRRLAGNFGKLFDFAIDIAENGLRADADFFEHGRNDAFFVFEQRRQQVQPAAARGCRAQRRVVRALDGFLRFYGEFFPTDGHDQTPLLCFCHFSEVKNLRNVPAARNAEVPSASSGQAFAGLRMAKLTGIKKTGGGQLLPPPVETWRRRSSRARHRGSREAAVPFT
jgi:hypothetical protein